jgi:hypothetical protein
MLDTREMILLYGCITDIKLRKRVRLYSHAHDEMPAELKRTAYFLLSHEWLSHSQNNVKRCSFRKYSIWQQSWKSLIRLILSHPYRVSRKNETVHSIKFSFTVISNVIIIFTLVWQTWYFCASGTSYFVYSTSKSKTG